MRSDYRYAPLCKQSLPTYRTRFLPSRDLHQKHQSHAPDYLDCINPQSFWCEGQLVKGLALDKSLRSWTSVQEVTRYTPAYNTAKEFSLSLDPKGLITTKAYRLYPLDRRCNTSPSLPLGGFRCRLFLEETNSQHLINTILFHIHHLEVPATPIKRFGFLGNATEVHNHEAANGVIISQFLFR